MNHLVNKGNVKERIGVVSPVKARFGPRRYNGVNKKMKDRRLFVAKKWRERDKHALFFVLRVIVAAGYST